MSEKLDTHLDTNFDSNWLDDLDLHGPAKNFAEFCKTEIARRSNTIEDFDEQTHKEAVEMILRKLGTMDMEKFL
jgi:hypothetical protein